MTTSWRVLFLIVVAAVALHIATWAIGVIVAVYLLLATSTAGLRERRE